MRGRRAGEERESFRAFAELLASLLHHEFRSRLEALKDTYHPFNPDSDTHTISEPGPAERQVAQQRLVDELTALAQDANFVHPGIHDHQVVPRRAARRLGMRPIDKLLIGIPAVVSGVAFGGYLVRQFTKFKNRKIQFMKALSENLYFRNLDNYAGVFHHLLDSAEEEEIKEAVLAYHFLRTAERRLTATMALL